MVAALVLLADVEQGEVSQAAHEVHGYLAGHGDVLAAALAAQVVRREGIVAGGLLDDDVRRGDVFADADDVLDGALDGIYGDGVVEYLLIGRQALAAMQPSSRTANDSSGVGRRDSNL